jgi:hypothetical protein
VLRNYQTVSLETVWKFGMGPESGLRKWPRGVEGVPIGRLLAPKKGGRDAFSYFPNSFSRDCLENSWRDRIERFLVAQSVEKEAFHPVPRARGTTKWSPFGVSRQSL